jgi:hypothetical protein
MFHLRFSNIPISFSYVVSLVLGKLWSFLGSRELSLAQLRSTSFICWLINAGLIYEVLGRQSLFGRGQNYSRPHRHVRILNMMLLSLFPPYVFFAFLYYTDMLAITTILITLLMSDSGHHIIASLIGSFSIMCRQTNCLWVIYIMVMTILGFGQSRSRKRNQSDEKGIDDMDHFPYSLLNLWKEVYDMTGFLWDHRWDLFERVMPYTCVCAGFVAFVLHNSGIALGKA